MSRLLALLVALAFARGQDAPACASMSRVTVQLQWIQQAQFAGFYAAVENGYYADECLEVTIKAGAPGLDMTTELRERRADFGVGWFSALVRESSGSTERKVDGCGDLPTRRYVNIMQHYQRSAYSHVHWKDVGVQSIRDLEGRRVGYWPGLDTEIKVALSQYNITNVTMQRIDFSVNPFLQRRVDSLPVMTYNELALVLQAPNAARSAAAGETVLNQMEDLNVVDLNDYSSLLQDGVITSHDWLEADGNRDVAQRFVTASMRGWMYCRDNEEDAVNLLFAGSPHQRWQMREVNRLIWPTDMSVPEDRFRTTVAAMREYGQYNTSDPTMAAYLREGGIYVNNFTRAAQQTLRTKYGADPQAPYPEREHIKLCARPDGQKGFRICPESTGSSDGRMTVFVVVLACVVSLIAVAGVAFAAHSRSRAKNIEQMTRHAPRAGPVALVFTDIKKSSELWGKYPEEMTIALATHHSICRRLLEQYCGYEVKTIGDAFMCAFGSTVSAVEFMMAFQQELLEASWPDVLAHHDACRIESAADGVTLFNGLRVRAGCHVGTVNVRQTPQGGYDYDGAHVNIAARVSDSGGGGQLLVTSAVYNAIEAELEDMFCPTTVQYLGVYSFKGIADPHVIYSISSDALRERVFEPMRGATLVDEESATFALDIGSKTSSFSGVGSASKASASVAGGGQRQLAVSMQVIRKWVARYGQKGVTPQELALTFRCGCDGLNMTETQVVGIVLTHYFRALEGGVRVGRARVSIRDEGSQAGSHQLSQQLGSHPSGGLDKQKSYAMIPSDEAVGLRWNHIVGVLQSFPAQAIVVIAEALQDEMGMQSRMSAARLAIERSPRRNTSLSPSQLTSAHQHVLPNVVP